MTRAIGNIAENIALNYLLKNDLIVITKNFYTKHGEIDLVMLDTIESHIVFVEVRYRKKISFCHPIETITKAKQQKIINSALFFLNSDDKFGQLQYRFDAVTITNNNNKNGSKNIEWFKNIITS